jgi:hypothetical protein
LKANQWNKMIRALDTVEREKEASCARNLNSFLHVKKQIDISDPEGTKYCMILHDTMYLREHCEEYSVAESQEIVGQVVPKRHFCYTETSSFQPVGWV